MALEGTYTTKSGIELEKAYFKVVQADLRFIEKKRRWFMRYTVAVYAHRAARRTDCDPVGYENYLMRVDLTGGEDKENIIKVCYKDFVAQNEEITFENA